MYGLSENIRVAMIALQMNKLRTALTMLGITIGVAAVILLVSAGQGVSAFVTNQFSGIGSNLVIALAQADKNRKLQPQHRWNRIGLGNCEGFGGSARRYY